MRKTLIQMRREFWECRASFVKTPAVMTVVLCALLLLGLVPLQNKIGGFIQEARLNHAEHLQVTPDSVVDNDGSFIGASPDHLVHGLAAVYTLFAVVLLLVLLFYFADTLYSDRRDQSILFWKSMPVSELKSLQAKLMAGVAGAPAVYGVAAMLTGAFYLVVFMVFANWIWDMPTPGLATLLATYLLSTVGLVLGWWLMALWMLPIFCWLLACSAAVKKAPFLLALGAPFSLIVLEGWVFGSTNFLGLVKGHIGSATSAFQSALHAPLSIGHHLQHILGSPALWVGLLVSLLLLAACVWLRKNRWEI